MMINPVNASKGHIIVYDPDFKPLPRVFQLNELHCLIDEKTDGLHATFEGKQHAVIVRVPASLMEKGGKYRFVIFAWDNHAHRHKDHKEKPALELNSEASVPEAHNYDGTDFPDVAELAFNRQRRVGYVAREWTDENPF